MTETLHFSVDGEFITDLARRLLWEDRRPYAQAAALLEDCCDGVPEDQKNEIIVSILEGRKKLVGINEFTSVAGQGSPLLLSSGRNARFNDAFSFL